MAEKNEGMNFWEPATYGAKYAYNPEFRSDLSGMVHGFSYCKKKTTKSCALKNL